MDTKSALYDIFNDSHDATERKTCSLDLQASDGHLEFPGWKHVSSVPVLFSFSLFFIADMNTSSLVGDALVYSAF